MTEEHGMIEINLNPPTTPEEKKSNIIGNVRLAKGTNIPFIDNAEEGSIEARQEYISYWPPVAVDDGKPRLRYFSVGPSTYQIRCPLCKHRADTETVQMGGMMEEVSCLLSLLSCCFPIFSLSFFYCCLSSQYKSKRMFCNKCGGHLGFYNRPT